MKQDTWHNYYVGFVCAELAIATSRNFLATISTIGILLSFDEKTQASIKTCKRFIDDYVVRLMNYASQQKTCSLMKTKR